MNPRNSTTVFERWATWVVLSFVVSLFLFQLYVIHKYAVDIPIIDDWAMFRPDRPAKLSVAWLLDTSNTRTTPTEHVIATTKLLVWIQYQLNGWNIHSNLVLNFLIFGFFVGWMFWFAERAAADIPRYVNLAFTIFLLSPIDWFNHFMATQTCYVFYLIFFFLGTYVLFRETQRWWHIVAGSLLSVLSIYSLASGFGSSLVLLVAFCVFKGARIYSKTNSARRIHEATQLAVTVFLIGGGLILWLAQYVKPAHVKLVFPNDLRFWEFFVNVVSFGFSIETSSFWRGLLCLLIVLVPICGIIWKRKGRLRAIECVCFVMVAGILVNVAQIALGRTYQDGPGGSKVLRYAEFVLPLIPLSMIAWAILFQGRKRLQAIALGVLFTFCFVTFANDWSFDVYRSEAARRIEGRECVKQYYRGTGDGRCPILYTDRAVNIPLTTWLENAKAVNVSFYRSIREEIERENQTQPGSR
jgi:hypothetical protein